MSPLLAGIRSYMTLSFALLATCGLLIGKKAVRASENYSEDYVQTDVTPFTQVRRVLFLTMPQPVEESQIKKQLERQRIMEIRAGRKRKRLFAGASTTKAPRNYKLLGQPAPPKAKENDDTVPPEQRRALAQALLVDVLAEKLHERAGIERVSDADVKATLASLKLSAQDALTPEASRKLCERLNCQAVVAPQVTQVAIREGMTREAVVYAAIALPKTSPEDSTDDSRGVAGVTLPNSQPHVGRPLNAAQEKLPTAQRRTDHKGVAHKPTVATPTELTVAGWASVQKLPFRTQYYQSQAGVIRKAVDRAALIAVHTLLTGQSAPLMRPDDKLAVLPVSAPTTADKLLFTSQGRRVIPASVRDLSADVSAMFTPDLLPLPPSSILYFKSLHNDEPTALLWKDEDTPDVQRVQALGKLLNVNYILLAHVSDIEIEEGPDTRADAMMTAGSTGTIGHPWHGLEREAKAETNGALVRIADGAILWKRRAVSTMTAHQREDGDPRAWPTERRLTESAIHFALIDLQRSLTRYRSGFEH